MSIKIKQLSSLAKVYPDKIFGKVKKQIRAAKGQSVSYQLAYRGEGELSYKIKSPLKKYLEVYQVGFVPCTLPTYEKCNDGRYQRMDKVLTPDTLTPKKTNKIKAEKSYNALWLEVKLPTDIEAGKYPITVIFSDGQESTFTVRVENVVFKEKEIVFKINYISPLGSFATWKSLDKGNSYDMRTFEIHALPLDSVFGLRPGMSVLVELNE